MPIRICSVCRRRACAFSPSMVRGAGPTWRCGCSPTRSRRQADQAVQPRQHAARFHLYRRRRAGGGAAGRSPADGRSELVGRGARSRLEQFAPWRVYNIGNNNPVELLEVVRMLEQAIGKKAIRELLPMQPGDVPATYRRCRRSHARRRLQAVDADRRGRRAFRRLVPRTITGCKRRLTPASARSRLARRCHGVPVEDPDNAAGQAGGERRDAQQHRHDEPVASRQAGIAESQHHRAFARAPAGDRQRDRWRSARPAAPETAPGSSRAARPPTLRQRTRPRSPS